MVNFILIDHIGEVINNIIIKYFFQHFNIILVYLNLTQEQQKKLLKKKRKTNIIMSETTLFVNSFERF